MSDSICVDASVAIQIVTYEEWSREAENLWSVWMRKGTQPIAPPIFPYEVCSVIRQKAQLRRALSPLEEREAIEIFLNLDIRTRAPHGHLGVACDLAMDLNLPTVYDAAYLALAKMEGCAFWTADRRFYNAVKTQFDFVHWLGEITTTTQ